MGLGVVDYLDDSGGGGGKVSAASVSCSICLDVVADNGDRSWAKLQCGHKFHLDCIGSAFNVKGAMQCPNCRKIEKGQWLYANGNRPLPEISMDDWTHDDDLYDLAYSEMSFGVHWCPFSGLTRLPSSFYEGEFSATAYPELIAHHAVFAEHTPVSSTAHPCPYIAYFGPVHPSSSASSVSVSDGSSFNNHWSGPAGPSEVSNSYGFPSMDVHYQNWDHSSPFATNNRVGTAEQSIPSMTQRGAARNNSDHPRPGMLPFIPGHSSTGRAPTSVTSSVLPRYPGTTTARPHDRSHQPHFLQSTSNPPGRTSGLSSRRRSSNLRGLAQAIPPTSSPPDQSSGFHFFSSSSSGRAFQEPENPLHEHYNVWDREHQPSFPVSQGDRGDSIWAPFHPPPLVSDTGIRVGSFRLRHGSDRTPSQNRS